MQCVILPETGENFHGNSIETEVQSSQCVGSLFFFFFISMELCDSNICFKLCQTINFERKYKT